MKQQNIEKKLRAMEAELTAMSESAEDSQKPVQLDQQSVGRLSRMDAMQGQAMAQANEQRRQLLLKQIKAALVRLEKGEYGICIDCGEAISERRLEADPVAMVCIDCQAERERKP
ncbi:TraR/DksA family transcriptional regulator [Aliidiomarina halalkaliphila]|uniref:TraR/DksA family transcriptional regulator n=1 Tax=Aliidiomarina halalkaliphila TaxID=2593535 RepID=A0A552X107_9GAMM|nr:TraR/DksA family transcriptional regulator [Aliidiomarina halalkaliphila]TRW48738.1 TraR/DksA family transcriptional regulator [Aliidiomarina halalkaliphila]